MTDVLALQRQLEQARINNEQLRAQLRRARDPMVMIAELRRQGIKVKELVSSPEILMRHAEVLDEASDDSLGAQLKREYDKSRAIDALTEDE